MLGDKSQTINHICTQEKRKKWRSKLELVVNLQEPDKWVI